MARRISSTTSIQSSDSTKHEELSDDIGNLVGDCSDLNSDDSGNWMQKIDVKDFRYLTGTGGHPMPSSEMQHRPFLLPHTTVKTEEAESTVLDHGHYSAPPNAGVVTSTVSNESFPSPDSNPPLKKERTSINSTGSLDSPRDYAAETQPQIESNVHIFDTTLIVQAHSRFTLIVSASAS